MAKTARVLIQAPGKSIAGEPPFKQSGRRRKENHKVMIFFHFLSQATLVKSVSSGNHPLRSSRKMALFPNLRPRGGRSIRAFTLVEMLVTLAIMALLVAIAAPAFMGTMRSYQLTSGGELVINQLNLARQAALSSSHLVQVRFYRLPDYEQAPTSAPAVYRAMQCFTEGDPGSTGTPALTAVTRPIFFPAPVIISTVSSPNVSSLLSPSPTAAASSDLVLPVYGSNYAYSAFHFRPDGSTDLAVGSSVVTLVLENDKAAAASGLPNNYQTLQIDPAIGTVRRFQP
jgi:uncharacterized protein (TIGR02596 family)